MRTAPGLVADGIAAGVLDAGAVLDGRVTVSPRSRSNIVHRVDVDDRPIAFVKQRGTPSLLDGDDAVGNERRALDLLRSSTCVPRVLSVAGPGSVWVAAVPGVELSSVGGDDAHLRAAGRAVGQALAELHRHPVDPVAPVAPRPWALHLDDLPPSMAGGAPGSPVAAVLEIAAEPDVRRAIDAATAGWRTECWTHGDLSPANILVGSWDGDRVGAGDAAVRGGSSSARLRATFVDLEGAGRGNPDWDLVTAVTSVRQVWPDPRFADPAADGLLTEYWRRGGPGRLSEALQCVRYLMTAWQAAASAATGATAGSEGDATPSDSRGGAEEWRALADVARGHAAATLSTAGPTGAAQAVAP